MTVTAARKSRPRRVAADEAHSWARNLKLGNPYAKLVLSMLTLYVQGDGICFVGIEALSEDTELSADTVRKRLAWLEQVGAIARFPQWIDANGGRNGEGRGKRTTDEIRLLMSADEGEIERRALGGGSESIDGVAETSPASETPISPRSQPGQQNENTPAQDSVSPRPALGQPSDSGKGLDSSEPEPEPRKNPPTPFGGCEQEIPCWEEFKTEFERDGEPIVKVTLAKQLFTALTWPDERQRVTKAARGLLHWRSKQKKISTKPSAQTLLREPESWPAWAANAPPEPVAPLPPAAIFIAQGSDGWRVLRVLAAVRQLDELHARDIPDHGKGIMVRREMTPQLLALAAFAPADGSPINTSEWLIVENGSQACGAWKSFAGAEPWNVPTGEVTEMRVGNKIIPDWQVKKTGLLVPCEWPPRKDGTIIESNSTEGEINNAGSGDP